MMDFGDLPAPCEFLDGVFLAARKSVLNALAFVSTNNFNFTSTISIFVDQHDVQDCELAPGR